MTRSGTPASGSRVQSGGARSGRRRSLIRILVVLTVLTGGNYVVWRWLYSVNWDNWWIGVPLVVAETYSLIDAFLFGATMWRLRERGPAPPPPPGATVDVFITTYNEPVEMVLQTAVAALAIHHPHRTWVLDDGDRAEMRAAADAAGVGYLTRSDDWRDRPRHAKAGNLNNALLETDGEFLLILDADQVPDPRILDQTLGWFTDERVALVQTPQWFSNVTDADPLGSQAPLFYGPIQQGKDGWNAAFFCGSNAVVRREALLQVGVTGYVIAVQAAARRALSGADRVLRRAQSSARRTQSPAVAVALGEVRTAARQAREELGAGVPVAEVTRRFGEQVDAASRSLVSEDMAGLRADLAALAELDVEHALLDDEPVPHQDALERLAQRDWSPLGALESIRALLRAIDVGRGDEAQPVMPMATISVTEDMATAMRLHAHGWRTVYHHQVLARGLAPDDLGTMLQQRLRWSQGTLQVLLRENPLTQGGLAWGQRLMYFSTMWSYLSGVAALVYIAAPVLYMCFGVLPVKSFSADLFLRLVPFLIANQLLFLVVGRGVKTWRGQQYSLALFPLWIRAMATAVANVYFGRSLGFVVTEKTRQDVGPQWRLVRPQLIAMALLAVAAVVGVGRLLAGQAPLLGVSVNLVWITYDLVVLGVVVSAVRYRGNPSADVTPVS